MPAVATSSKGAKAVKTKMVDGRMVSAKSKTGDPACSQAMSVWVRARHSGAAVAAEVFKILGKCRAKARQNSKAAQQQASGKLAEGRGTWQRSERAAQLMGQRGGRPSSSTTSPTAQVSAAPAPKPATRKAPAKGPVGGSELAKSTTTSHPTGKAFADRVAASAATVGAEGRFGDNKVYIADAHAAYEAAHGKIPLADFKARLTEANQQRHLDLVRADLVEAMPKAKVAASEATHVNASFHFVRTAPKAGTGTEGYSPTKGRESAPAGKVDVSGHRAKLAEALKGSPRDQLDRLHTLRGDVFQASRAAGGATPETRALHGEIQRHMDRLDRQAGMKPSTPAQRVGGIKAGQAGFRERLAAAKPKPAAPAGPPKLAGRKEPLGHRITPATKTREQRLGELINRAGGLERRSVGRLSADSGKPSPLFGNQAPAGPARGASAIRERDTHTERKRRLEKALEATRPEKAAPAFSLKPAGGGQRGLFGGNAGGKTGALFDEMKGAGARDLPGQSTMFGGPDKVVHRLSAAPARERADLRAVPKGTTAAQLADQLWEKGQKQQAKGDPAAAETFARHDQAMRGQAHKTDRAGAASILARARARVAAKTSTTAPSASETGAAEWRALIERSRLKGTPSRDRKAAALKGQRKELADARASSVKDMDTKSIDFDPDRFQYKLDASGAHGTTGNLHGVKKWDPELGGVLQVWKDPGNGKTYVVNGHHRLDLAKRLGAEKVSVRYIKAANEQEARAKGALTNIAEGRGTSTDAAQFFRDSGHTRQRLEAEGVSLREKTATEGLALAGLEEGLWRRHKNGDLPTERAAIIGGSGATHAEQKSVGEQLDKMGSKAPSNKVLARWIDDSKAAPTVTKKTRSLFGDDEEEVNLGLHKAGVSTAVEEALSREKRLFGTVAKSRNAEDLERAGNQINAEESAKLSDAAKENLAVYRTVRKSAGPVAALENEAAERIHKGEPKAKVYSDVLKRLPAAVEAMQRL